MLLIKVEPPSPPKKTKKKTKKKQQQNKQNNNNKQQQQTNKQKSDPNIDFLRGMFLMSTSIGVLTILTFIWQALVFSKTRLILGYIDSKVRRRIPP